MKNASPRWRGTFPEEFETFYDFTNSAMIPDLEIPGLVLAIADDAKWTSGADSQH